MQVYELGYLVLPSIPEENLGSTVDSLKSVISKAGGSIFDGEAPFMHDLAYPMSKTVGASKYVVNNAYIGWVKFECEPANIAEVKAAMEKMDEILRFLLIKTSRETTFTFAKAREVMGEKEAPAPGVPAEEVVAPVEGEETKVVE